MCRDSLAQDLRSSRLRWYDLASVAFGERPVRCRMCGQRYFGIRASHGQYRLLHRTWLDYAVLAVVALSGLAVTLKANPRFTPNGIERVRVDRAQASVGQPGSIGAPQP